jgi:5-oxoprolinase (ATP-hydrolysing) subunit A
MMARSPIASPRRSSPVRRIDLNADVGEGFADHGVIPFVTSASIACGGHAGDQATMRRAAALAVAHRVTIGAHPGFPDRPRFGRAVTTRDPSDIEELIVAQVAELGRQIETLGARIAFVKPHGALYNLAADDEQVAQAVARAVRRALPDGRLVLLAGSRALAVASRAGVPAVAEGFVDRGYLSTGMLAPRGTSGASIADADEAAERALALARGRSIPTVDGGEIVLEIDTLCLHGDGPNARAVAERVRRRLDSAGLIVAPFVR